MATLLVATSCGEAVFACMQDSDCSRGDRSGICEASGFCSFADDDCASGSRYGARAGDGLAGDCVASEDASSSGSGGVDPSTTITTLDPTYEPPAETSSSSDASASDGDATTDDDVPTGVCGDGIVDEHEQCDDGDDIDGDGCNADCIASGSMLWSFVDDAATGEAAHAIAVLQDGTVIAGASIGTADGRHVLQARAFTDEGADVWAQSFDTTAVPNEGAHAWGLAIADDGAIALCGTLDAEAPHWVAHGLQAIDGTAVWSADGPGACNEARFDGDRQVWLLGEDDDGGAQILVVDHGVQIGAFDASWFPATARPRDLALVSGGWISVGALDGLVVDNAYVASSATDAIEVNPGSSWSIAHALAASDDTYVIVGAISNGLPGGEPQGDGWIGRYDGDSATAQIAIAEAGLDALHDVAIAGNGDVIAVGWHAPDDAPQRIVAQRFTSELRVRWTSSLAVASDLPDRAYSIAIGPQGELYVAGVADLGPASAPWIARLAQ